MDFLKLGNRIREERIKMNLTQEQLSEKINISKNFVSLIENGQNMSVEILVSLAQTFGVTVDYLLSDLMPPQEYVTTLQICHYLNKMSESERLLFLNFFKNYTEIQK